MGTPEFAVPSLDILLKNGYEVVGVITSTDKYGGRGNKKLIESAIKKYAVKKGLKVLQPKNLKAPEFVAELRSLNADLQVVVAFRMLPVIVWDMPTIGTINLHGSLLPKYRGAAPINWAVINGEKETGVTTFFIRHEIDTGDLLFQEKMPIGADETVGEVHDRMMYLGADLVLKTVKAIESNNYQLRKQDESLVSKAPKIYTADCEINFNQPTQKVHDFIRGLSPYPTAWTTLNELKLKIFKASREISKHTYAAGQFFTDNKNYLKISTADGFIQIHNLQLQGRKRLGVKDFLNGYKIVLDMNEKKRYNIFVSTKMNTFNILDIDESELEKIIALYKYGKDNIFLKGKKYWFSDLSEIQIYTFENEKIKTEQELISLCKSKKLFKSGMFGHPTYIPKEILEKVGTRITDKFITNDFGYLKDNSLDNTNSENYVNPQRINEIEQIEDENLDFTKLVAILKELNVAYSHNSFFSIAPLVRAIIDHVPPIFDKGSFKDVCDNCGTKSFRDSMNNLNKSCRKIADSYLHNRIRKKETLPNKTQINFKNDLDVLLQEIVRIKKK